LNQLSKISGYFLFLLCYFPKFANSLLILLIYSYFISPYKLQISINRFYRILKNLSYFLMTWWSYIITQFNYQFDMSPKFFEISIKTITTLFFLNLYFFFNINKIFINSINFLFPFKWINFSFYDLLIFCLIFNII